MDPEETFCLLDCKFITNDGNSGTACWQRCMGQGIEKGWRPTMHSQQASSPYVSTVFSSSEALGTQSFGVFMKASLHRHKWLINSLAISDWIQSPGPFSSLEVRDLKLKIWASNQMVGSSGNQTPSLSAIQCHFINKTKDTFVTLITGNSKAFKTTMPEMETKTKCLFTINHSLATGHPMPLGTVPFFPSI